MSEAVTVRKTTAIDAVSPLALLEKAMSIGATAEQIGKMMDLQERYAANAAKEAFMRDLSAFQAEAPIIEPLDAGDKAKYAKLDRIHREIRPLKTKYGLSVIWTDTTISEDGGMCKLRGFLVHRGGHSLPVAFDIPIPAQIVTREGKTLGNASQSMGSAVSYGRRYGEAAVLNLVMGKDDDGAGGMKEAPASIDGFQVEALRAELKAKNRDEAKTLKWAGVARIEDMTAAQFTEAMRMLAKVQA